MRMTLSTWNGHSIQDTSFQARELVGVGNGTGNATPNFIDMGKDSRPQLGGVSLVGSQYTFTVQVRGTTDATRESNRNTLNSWFLPGTTANLVGLDGDNGNKDWYLNGTVVIPPTIVAGALDLYQITIALSEPFWIEVDLNTNTWTVTADTETEIMANVGNAAALPKFELSAVNGKVTNLIGYKRFYAVHTSGYGGYFPVDITEGVLNTSALIGAGKMLASGDDLLVSVNGRASNRYLRGLNTTTTSVWTALSFTPAPHMRLVTTLDGSTTPASITVGYGHYITAGQYPNINNLPEYGCLLFGTECITYSTYTIDQSNQTITFIPTLRGAKGSAKAAHVPAIDVYWIENEVWVTYGNPDAPAYQTGTDEPVFDIATSTNASWNYLVFSDADNNLGYQMPPYKSGNGNYYTGVHGAIASPATEIGILCQSLTVNGRIIPDSSSKANWVFFHPGGISNFEANGEKYRSAAEWGTLAIIGEDYIFYTEPSPTVVTTWEAIAINQATASNPTQIRFSFSGGLGTTLPVPYAMAEFTDVTLTNYDPPVSANIGVSLEQAAYNFNGYLKNNTTGDIINLNNVLTKTLETITIDCETQEVYSTDGQRLRGNITFGGNARTDWLTLEAGNNSIIFADVGTSNLVITTTWRARNTI